jgi:hypothetical protein
VRSASPLPTSSDCAAMESSNSRAPDSIVFYKPTTPPPRRACLALPDLHRYAVALDVSLVTAWWTVCTLQIRDGGIYSNEVFFDRSDLLRAITAAKRSR